MGLFCCQAHSSAIVPSTIPSYSIVADSSEATGLKWAAPAGGSFVGCSISKSANQNISNNTNTLITFDTEEFDTDSFHSTSTNTSRITIPAGKGGYYQVNFRCMWNDSSINVREMYILKNGSSIALNAESLQTTGNSRQSQMTAQVINLVANDYIEMQCFQNSGGSVEVKGLLDTNISVYYLGA